MVNTNKTISTGKEEPAVTGSSHPGSSGAGSSGVMDLKEVFRPALRDLAPAASPILALDGAKNSFKGNVFAAFLFATLGLDLTVDPRTDPTFLSFFYGYDDNGVPIPSGTLGKNAILDLLLGWLGTLTDADKAAISAFRSVLDKYRQAAINAGTWGDDCFFTYKMIRDIAGYDFFLLDKQG